MKTTGFGLGTVLFLIFLTLKLMGYITWSWWWVTAPLWIPFFEVMIAVILFILIFYPRKSKIIMKRKNK